MPDGDWAGWTLDPTLTLQPDASSGIDTFAKEDDANTNKGTSTQIEIRNTAGARRHGLLKFSGISSIPAGASIDSATLSLWSNRQVSADIVTSFHSILVANSGWTESGATWNYAVASSTRWAGDTGNDGGTDAGCSVSGTDYNSTQMGTFTYSSGTPTGTEHQASLNTSQVEAWLTANYGMVILQDASNFMYWRSSDHATAATRPKLVIEYTVGGAVQALHHYRMRRVA